MKNQPQPTRLEVEIQRIVPDGYGIGFAQNLTIFVPLVAPGDRVIVELDRIKGKIAFGRAVEIIRASAQRTIPRCPYFGRCGGCDFQHLEYDAQLAAKIGIIKDSLRRIAKIDWTNEIKIFAAPEQYNYRTRAQWKRRDHKLGYFERDSHRVCDVEVCPILSEPLQRELKNSRERLNKNDLPPEIKIVSAGEQISRLNATEDNRFDENFYAANHEQEKENTTALNEFDNAFRESARFRKAETISLRVNNFDYEFSAATFFQVNHSLLPQFVEHATARFEGEFALDLYCGVGLFTLPLSRNFAQVVGVEGNQTAVEYARRNAARAEIQNANFETAFVGDWLRPHVESLKQTTDFVLLDPPRTGAERETINALLEIRPKQIAYASCNPSTLARDLRLFTENGDYQIDAVTAFDFFPCTHHVETVVNLICSTSL